MEQRTDGRRLCDIRTLTEALYVAHRESGKSVETVAEALKVKRGYLADALNTAREDVLRFPALQLVPFCKETSALPLHWMADQLGFVLVPREHAATATNLAMETLDVQERAGALAARVRRAVADGRIDQFEASDIRDEARRVQREAAEVERAVDAMPVQIGRHA